MRQAVKVTEKEGIGGEGAEAKTAAPRLLKATAVASGKEGDEEKEMQTTSRRKSLLPRTVWPLLHLRARAMPVTGAREDIVEEGVKEREAKRERVAKRESRKPRKLARRMPPMMPPKESVARKANGTEGDGVAVRLAMEMLRLLTRSRRPPVLRVLQAVKARIRHPDSL